MTDETTTHATGNAAHSAEGASLSIFEQIRHTDDDGAEYWSARELADVLGYETNYRNFKPVVDKAMGISRLLRQNTQVHFVPQTRNIAIGSGAEREVDDWRLTSYAPCLIIMNSDLTKPKVVQTLAYITHTLANVGFDAVVSHRSVYIPNLETIAITQEQKTIGQIARAFRHLSPQQQFRVAPYYIDLYLPSHKIAVECDENGHKHVRREDEQARQSSIERQLGCRFVRYNPDHPDFNVGDVINQIMRLIWPN